MRLEIHVLRLAKLAFIAAQHHIPGTLVALENVHTRIQQLFPHLSNIFLEILHDFFLLLLYHCLSLLLFLTRLNETRLRVNSIFVKVLGPILGLECDPLEVLHIVLV